jgi:hypothetical protein
VFDERFTWSSTGPAKAPAKTSSMSSPPPAPAPGDDAPAAAAGATAAGDAAADVASGCCRPGFAARCGVGRSARPPPRLRLLLGDFEAGTAAGFFVSAACAVAVPADHCAGDREPEIAALGCAVVVEAAMDIAVGCAVCRAAACSEALLPSAAVVESATGGTSAAAGMPGWPLAGLTAGACCETGAASCATARPPSASTQGTDADASTSAGGGADAKADVAGCRPASGCSVCSGGGCGGDAAAAGCGSCCGAGCR